MRTLLFALIALASTSTALAQYGDLNNDAERKRFEDDQKLIADSTPPDTMVSNFNGQKLTYRLVRGDEPIGKPSNDTHGWEDAKGNKGMGQLSAIVIVVEIKTAKLEDGVWRGKYGKIIKIPLEKLSPRDQKAIKARIATMPLPCDAKEQEREKAKE